MMPLKQVPPVILKFGEEMSTTDGSNAAGPALSTVAYSSVLSNPSSTVPKSSAASESCGVACTVTTARPPLPPATAAPGIAPAAIVSNAIT